MGKVLNLGIMGAGGIAGTMAGTVNKMENVKCYAVASRTQEKADAFGQKFDVEKCYGSYEEMLADEKVDLVYVATPHSEHYENMKQCIRYKKPILCVNSPRHSTRVSIVVLHDILPMRIQWHTPWLHSIPLNR